MLDAKTRFDKNIHGKRRRENNWNNNNAYLSISLITNHRKLDMRFGKLDNDTATFDGKERRQYTIIFLWK